MLLGVLNECYSINQVFYCGVIAATALFIFPNFQSYCCNLLNKAQALSFRKSSKLHPLRSSSKLHPQKLYSVQNIPYCTHTWWKSQSSQTMHWFYLHFSSQDRKLGLKTFEELCFPL